MHFNANETVLLYAVVWFFSTALQHKFYFYKNSIRFYDGILYVKWYSILSALSFLLFFILIVFREDVGNDYARYVQLYHLIGNNKLSSGTIAWLKNSPAFLFINKILFVLGLNFHFVLAAFAFLSLYCLYKAIQCLSVNWTWSIFLYFGLCYFFHNFNIIRQVAAASLLLLGGIFLVRDDLKKFLVTLGIASLFHSTVLFCIVLWPLRKVYMTPKNVVRYVVVGVIFFVFFDYFLRLFSWSYYVSPYSESTSSSRMYALSAVLNLGVRITLFAICLYFYKDVLKLYGTKYVSVYNAVMLCTIAQIGSVRFYVFGRITIYFFIFYIVLLPAVFSVFEKRFTKDSRIFVVISEILAVLLYHYTYYFSPNGASGCGYQFYNFISL